MRRAIWERSIGDGSIRFKIAARRAPVNLVEEVEEIGAELNGRLFTDRKALLNRQIRVERVRAVDTVPTYSSNLVQTGLGEECTRAREWIIRLTEELQVVPRRSCNAAVESTWISINLAWNATRYRIAARAIAKRKGQAAGVGKHWTELPASNELIDNTADIAGKHLVSSEGQLIQAINNNLLFPDKTVAALHSRFAPGGIARGPTGCTLPSIVSIHGKSMRELLGKSDLKCIEVTVEIIAVIGDAVGPTALSASEERIRWNDMVSRIGTCR